jgi:protein ImuA
MTHSPASQLLELREKIRRLEGSVGSADGRRLTLGIPVLDAALPASGLPLGYLHEVFGPPGDAARFGFVTALAARLAGSEGRVFWCCGRGQELGAPYGVGLRHFGLSPAQIIFAAAERPVDALWAMEEVLRSGLFAAVIGEEVAPDITASRRLQLAAEIGTTPVFILPLKEQHSLVAPVRWHIASLPADDNQPRWQMDLQRCRGGTPRTWRVNWDDAALCLRLAADLADRSLATAARA